MNLIAKLITGILGITFMTSSIVTLILFSDMGEKRVDYLAWDQGNKSSIELNVAVSGGSRELTASEVRTSILSYPELVRVMVNGRDIPYEARILAAKKGQNISSYIPEDSYTASYTYDTAGNISQINFVSVH